MIQYHQLSLFDVMPDAKVNSFIEQLPCRVAKSRIRSSKPKLPYFHWRITNIYDYADHPIDCLKGPYEKTGLRFASTRKDGAFTPGQSNT